MSRKAKFRPVISRVRLNPEQAVLSCSCYDHGTAWSVAYGATLPPIPQDICWIEQGTKMTIGGGDCEIIPGPYPVGQSVSFSEAQS